MAEYSSLCNMMHVKEIIVFHCNTLSQTAMLVSVYNAGFGRSRQENLQMIHFHHSVCSEVLEILFYMKL